MEFSQREAMLAEASVSRTTPHFDDRTPNLLLGNGLWGGCVDSFGMADTLSGMHQSYLWHQFHVELGRDRRECRIPLLLCRYQIEKDGKPVSISCDTVSQYRQTLFLAQATILTEYKLFAHDIAIAQVQIQQYLSLAEPHHACWEISVDPLCGPIDLSFQVEMLDHCISMHNIPISYPVHAASAVDFPVLTSVTSRGETHVAAADPEADIRLQEKTIFLQYHFSEKRTVSPRIILINHREQRSLEEALRKIETLSAAVLKQPHLDSWNQFWSRSFIDPGNGRLFGIWARFLYCLRSSQSDHPSVPMSPGGLASSALWPFEFPQDFLWIYESFFGVNHMELAASTKDYWSNILEQARTFTKKSLGVEGVFFPWMPSHFDNKEQTLPGYDFPFPYQLHNSAYLLRMCWLYWQYSRDVAYLESVLPVAEGVADFYSAISTYMPETQKYEIHFTPCMGQDEYGSFNRSNYLCCMTSAAIAIRMAIQMYEASGNVPKQKWLSIQNAGYAFDKLMSSGLLATYEGGPTPNPKQKHPSQLNTLAALPLPEIYSSQVFFNTYMRRYEISRDSDKNIWCGWSLGTFLIASVRMQLPQECQKDFDMLLQNQDAPIPQLDRDGLQMVESSRHEASSCYFHTGIAMVVTAITELFLQTFDGICKVFPVMLPSLEDQPLRFFDLLSPFGCTVSGTLENGNATVELHITEKVAFTLQLGPACLGQYVLTDQYGNAIQKSACKQFRLCLDPGIYTIHT